jgi:lysophospholipase L1-like esterase
MKHFRTRVVLVAASLMTLLTFAACGSSPTAPPPSSQLRITCPPAVEGQSPDGQPVAVTFGAPLTSGGTAPVNLACTPVSGSLFSGGTTSVTCTASDARGVTAACTTSVFVRLPARLVGTKFMAFGDSITAGRYSDPVRSIIVDGGITYTTILEARLKSQYPQQASSIVIANEGLPSDTAITADEKGRFRDAMQRHRPEILLLLMGTNDILEPDGVNRGIQALQRMITLAKSSGFNARVVLATVPPQRGGVPPIRPVPHLVPVINDRIRQLAAQENVPLADVYNAMKDDLFLIGQDNLHPTPAGMDVIAKVFFDTIKASLEAPQPAAQGMQ